MYLDTMTDKQFFDKYADIEDDVLFILQYLNDAGGSATEDELEDAMISHALCRTVVDGWVIAEFDDEGSGLYRKNPDADWDSVRAQFDAEV